MQDTDPVKGHFWWSWLNALLDNPPDPSTAYILIQLGRCSRWSDGARCWPSVELLAERCACDARTIRRALKRGADLGWLQIVEKRGRTNSYVLTPLISVRGDNLSGGTDCQGGQFVRGDEVGEAGAVADNAISDNDLSSNPPPFCQGGQNGQTPLTNCHPPLTEWSDDQKHDQKHDQKEQTRAGEAARPVGQGDESGHAATTRPVASFEDEQQGLADWLAVELQRSGWSASAGEVATLAAALERHSAAPGEVRAYAATKIAKLAARASRPSLSGAVKIIAMDAAAGLRAAGGSSVAGVARAPQARLIEPAREPRIIGAVDEATLASASGGALAWLVEDKEND